MILLSRRFAESAPPTPPDSTMIWMQSSKTSRSRKKGADVNSSAVPRARPRRIRRCSRPEPPVRILPVRRHHKRLRRLSFSIWHRLGSGKTSGTKLRYLLVPTLGVGTRRTDSVSSTCWRVPTYCRFRPCGTATMRMHTGMGTSTVLSVAVKPPVLGSILKTTTLLLS